MTEQIYTDKEILADALTAEKAATCLLYTSPSPRATR